MRNPLWSAAYTTINVIHKPNDYASSLMSQQNKGQTYLRLVSPHKKTLSPLPAQESRNSEAPSLRPTPFQPVLKDHFDTYGACFRVCFESLNRPARECCQKLHRWPTLTRVPEYILCVLTGSWSCPKVTQDWWAEPVIQKNEPLRCSWWRQRLRRLGSTHWKILAYLVVSQHSRNRDLL